jgi:hypothetical protein
MAWAERTRNEIVPTMHLVETPHFLLFSAWNRSNDQALRNVCEDMYNKLSSQFSLSKNETIWIGKCPIYIFWETEHFKQFTRTIDNSGNRDAGITRASGYHSRKGIFSYIVMNRTVKPWMDRNQAIQRFYEVLVHEGTHAFMNRYISNWSIPLWVNEGLAEFMAATLVPLSSANRDYINEVRNALLSRRDMGSIFRARDLSSREYDLAQSLVRYLVAHNSKSFIELIGLLKEGYPQSMALKKAYNTDQQELILYWSRYWRRQVF